MPTEMVESASAIDLLKIELELSRSVGHTHARSRAPVRTCSRRAVSYQVDTDMLLLRVCKLESGLGTTVVLCAD